MCLQIPHILEMYGQTEGTSGLMNSGGKPGAIGFLPQIVPYFPAGLIRVDDETGQN